MAIVAITSPRPRVGKTQAAVHLAHGAAITGLKTLLIDASFDCRASQLFDCVPERYESSFAGLLAAQGILTHVPAGAIIDNVRPLLSLLPSHPALRSLAEELFNDNPQFDTRLMLGSAFQACSQKYDLVVIDTSAGINIASQNALAAAQLVILTLNHTPLFYGDLAPLLNIQSALSSQNPLWYFLETMVNERGRDEDLWLHLQLCFEKHAYDVALLGQKNSAKLLPKRLESFIPEITDQLRANNGNLSFDENNPSAANGNSYMPFVEEVISLMVQYLARAEKRIANL